MREKREGNVEENIKTISSFFSDWAQGVNCENSNENLGVGFCLGLAVIKRQNSVENEGKNVPPTLLCFSYYNRKL